MFDGIIQEEKVVELNSKYCAVLSVNKRKTKRKREKWPALKTF